MNMLRRLFACCALLLSLAASAAVFEGRVVGVVDGDTIDILTPEHQRVRVRIAGIDAPEKRQPFGQVAKQRMSALAMGKAVRVESNKLDRYGRTVGVVFADGKDVGLELIRDGLAWHYKRYERTQSPDDRTQYAAAEVEAQRIHAGIWKDAEQVPPWDWRRR